MSFEDLPRNLRLACGYRKSISDVCRRTEINRQQFNKYLSGASRPSAHNMHKICRFFAIDEHELLLPHEHFERVMESRQEQRGRGGDSDFRRLIERAVPENAQDLQRYAGYYHSHHYALGWKGRIMRTLTCLYERDGRMYMKSIERFREPRRQERFVMKYDGLVTLLSNRLFLIEFDSLLGGGIATTILNTSYRSHITLLTGLTFGASTGRGRVPAAARVVYEYLGTKADRRDALAACGAFPEDSEAIDPEIKRLIVNDIGPEDKVLLGLAG